MIYLYYSEKFQDYNFGPEHPFNPVRLMLAYKLMEEEGMIDGLTCKVEPQPAAQADLERVHTPEYIASVQAEEPDLAFGLGSDDTPVFPGIYAASRLLAGSSIDAARRMTAEDCSAFNIGGGLHHAMPTRASGFCVFDDPALAISVLKERFERVLYIDIDGHHGDGVQQIFYEDFDVLTISMHESGLYLFPGTGFIDELGAGPGLGYSVNIPMPMYSGNEEYLRAFEEIVPRLFEWFEPQAVVAQLGVDTHYSDPLTTLNMTLAGYAHLVRRIIELTRLHAGGRLLALGGGGYNMEVVPVAFASVLHLMRGEQLPEYLPPCWVEFFSNLVDREPLSPPDIEIKVGNETKKRITAELDVTLQGLKEKINEIHRVF
ncbi:MAG: Histone deacetylase domain protein [Methanosaeta sp. PtaU1.Bin112]|nr:MAG: Histone deacetylase domain protein [Methanosaeta sp. PtaU1.Bin112]